eukprot:6486508-Amphidinium_carterae.1
MCATCGGTQALSVDAPLCLLKFDNQNAIRPNLRTATFFPRWRMLVVRARDACHCCRATRGMQASTLSLSHCVAALLAFRLCAALEGLIQEEQEA